MRRCEEGLSFLMPPITMRFDARQQMRLGQQMKLAPHMIQSMEILQLPLQELQERIDQELESNVALEIVTPESEEQEGDSTEPTEGEQEFVAGESGEDFNRLDEMERRYSDVWDSDDSMRSTPRATGERDAKMDALANTAQRSESLTSQLLGQWRLVEAPSDVHQAGKRLIEYVNDDGLLGADLETVLEQTSSEESGFTIELLEKALMLVQQELEPQGLMARDRRECLLLQLAGIIAAEGDDDGVWTDAQTLIREAFGDLVENRLPKIAKELDLDVARVQQARDAMKRLSLWPGRELVNPDATPIMPDVVVEYEPESDTYIAALASGVVPPLRINPQYSKMAKDKKLDKGAREFVEGSVKEASWLIDAVNQRSNTLLRVVRAVLLHQREFFDHGPQHLKPLPMGDVADQLGIHVATVSREVAEKWIQTPRGVYPLRRFFSGGLEGEDGEDRSWEAVKELLKEIVEGEDKAKPLSDQALADLLAERGAKIARRTVVKYREQLGIPPARRRRIHG